MGLPYRQVRHLRSPLAGLWTDAVKDLSRVGWRLQ
jgi:hypothetical protein